MLASIFLIAANVFDSATFNNFVHSAFLKLANLGERLILAVVVFFIGRWVIKWLNKFVHKILLSKELDQMAVSFISNTTDIIFKIILALIIISILGVETTSFAAIIAAAGLAVGMAMKDNLSNFAGGVMILLNKPFKIGDTITAQNMTGSVKDIGILYTILLTPDNRTIFLPNGPLSTGVIINVTAQPERRLDITLNINYGNNPDDLKTILTEVVNDDERILKTPAPFVGVTLINNGNFDIVIRVWTKTSYYSGLNIALNERIYKVFSEHGIYTSSTLSVKLMQ